MLFKCHDWQPFEQRQLERLRQRVRSGEKDIFVFSNDPKGDVTRIDHPAEQIMYAGLAEARAIGLEHTGDTPVFWFSNDYPLHIFSRNYPAYDYYLMIEYDVVPYIDFEALVQRLWALNVDFVGEPIRVPLAEWSWRESCDGWYDTQQILHWLSCFAIFSNRAAHLLFERRVAAGQKLRAGLVQSLPMCEAVIPTEMRLAGMNLMQLNELGSTTIYDTTPHYPEARIVDFHSPAFIHPVLDQQRFLAKVFNSLNRAEDLLDAGHPYRAIMTDAVFAAALPRIFHAMWNASDNAGCRRVLAEMQKVTDPSYRHLHGLDGKNLAIGKPASQSSLCEWSLRPDEASGAVTGPVSGRFTYHTRHEDRPWWMVDLLTIVEVSSIKIFNRMDIPSRANGLEVFVSADGRKWDPSRGAIAGSRRSAAATAYLWEVAVNRAPYGSSAPNCPGPGFCISIRCRFLENPTLIVA